jgi:hypothetical protein
MAPSRLALSLSLLAVLALTACSSRFSSKEMGLSWQPPRGVELVKQEFGSMPSATFSGGHRIIALSAKPLVIEEVNLVAIGDETIRLLGEGAKVERSSVGTIPAGPVARFEIGRGEDRILAYYVLLGNRAVVLSLTQSPASFAQASNKFEMSLSSLRRL